MGTMFLELSRFPGFIGFSSKYFRVLLTVCPVLISAVVLFVSSFSGVFALNKYVTIPICSLLILVMAFSGFKAYRINDATFEPPSSQPSPAEDDSQAKR